MALNVTCSTVMSVQVMIELSMYWAKLMDAPDPPSARASALVARPSTRRRGPNVKSTGRRLSGSPNIARLLLKAVRNIQ